jgi:hypothetical protein
MKISKLIHPELVLGTRGSEALTKSYRNMIEKIDFNPEVGCFSVRDTNWQYFDSNLKEHLMLTWKFKKEYRTTQKPGIYYVPAPFTEAISKLDRNIPVDLLPERFFAYFAFADGAMQDEKDEVQGAYVFVGPANESCLAKEYHYSGKVIWISYVCKDMVEDRENPDYYPTIGVQEGKPPLLMNFLSISKLLVPVTDKKISKLIEDVPILDFQSTKHTDDPEADEIARNRVFRTLINLSLYVNSIDADLVKAPLTVDLSHKQKAKRRDAGKPINECTVPLTLVSWNYERPRQYSVGSAWIDTHQRWQRCGPEHKQVKLIWVAPHERHYKKQEEPACPTALPKD